jgi:hypothetical protein
MPNATVRANARTMPEAKPGSVASIRRQTADLKSATAMLRVAQVVERGLAEPDVRPPLERGPDLLAAVDELNLIRHLVDAAHMAVGDLGDCAGCEAVRTLLDVILERLEVTTEKVDAARPRKEHANV